MAHVSEPSSYHAHVLPCPTIGETLIKPIRSRTVSTPIAVLIPELLTQIFEHVASDQPPHRDWTRQVNLGWIHSTTHVCHYWRQVALAHPMLWTNIAFNIGSKWAEEMVSRSKTAPLYLTWKPQDFSLSRSVVERVVTAELTRTRELDILAAMLLDDLFQSLLSLPAPMLEVVRLHTNDFNGTNTRTPIHRQIPPAFFQGKAPRLRELSLTNIGSSWTSLPTIALRSLSISFLTDQPHTIPMPPHALDQFIDFLESTPTLEEFVLRQGLPYNSSLPQSGDRVVRLPHLKRIDLMGPCLAIANVLRHIDTNTLLELHLGLLRNNHPRHTFPDHGFLIPPHIYPVLDVLVVYDRPERGSSLQDFVIAHPAPNLSKLELGSDRRRLLSSAEAIPASHALPKFVGNRAPKLQHLNLRGFAFSLDSLPVASLTHLRLVLPNNTWPLLTADRLLDRLESTPTLQVLSLAYCLPPHTIGSTPHTSDRMVSLPDLEMLTLFGKDCDVAAITRHIDLPVKAKLNITSIVLQDPTGDKVQPLATFPFSESIPAQSFVCSLKLWPDHPKSGHLLEVRGYRREHLIETLALRDQLECDRDPDVRIALRVPVAPSSLLQNIQMWSPAVQFEAVVVCIPHSRGRWNLAAQDWRDVFRQFRAVQHAEIQIYRSASNPDTRTDIFNLLRGLAVARNAQKEDEDAILPNLKSVQFSYHGYLLGAVGERLRTLLISVLTRWRGSGVRLHSLFVDSFDSATDCSSSLDIFTKIADKIYWDSLRH
ncbi:hypothetical protein BV25DRAFT_1828609 [Artomyces pyxidatus]|uniref:Uncharacterized protein n=1 Tax=Artomyces pyxidatus TaxID=48021 RepID=A0ACB8STG3_9AGAM|nr:hypothetical protein BV25DRAFT_1828609 [Artomyces pyxidatus]